MATTFARAQDVPPFSPLLETEKPPFFKKMRNSVVVTFQVISKKRVGVGSRARAGEDENDIRYGSGFVFSSEGHILTWGDNIKGNKSSKIQVQFFQQNEPIDASVVYSHPTKNVAILKPKDCLHRPVAYAELADNEAEVGMEVYCIGHPLGLTYNMLIGQVGFPGARQYGEFVELDNNRILRGKAGLDDKLALIQLNNIHGSDAIEGAPVFDASGRVLGMLAFCLTLFDFAIHHKELKAVIGEFKGNKG
ncbi:putative peptidase S1, PA clan [Rosa chinensis]|uniref:Putative peptidase S1, PA clan n=1 Tax=Rosa chinensis TaxID=74649 RepID=A0A2P6P3I6_ROSCH|nr:protease Do-like 1, chloroplastic [Rosa chinensis]PRQ16503.1 putative peptidase S1, PA clan [Rosa chinensis]